MTRVLSFNKIFQWRTKPQVWLQPWLWGNYSLSTTGCGAILRWCTAWSYHTWAVLLIAQLYWSHKTFSKYRVMWINSFSPVPGGMQTRYKLDNPWPKVLTNQIKNKMQQVEESDSRGGRRRKWKGKRSIRHGEVSAQQQAGTASWQRSVGIKDESAQGLNEGEGSGCFKGVSLM